MAVKVGLNLRPGQRLLIRASLETAPLVRLVAAHAYRAGCRLVETLWNDPELLLARFNYAPKDSFDEHATWWVTAGLEYAERGDALLSIAGADPDLLNGQDPQAIATWRKAEAVAARPLSKYIVSDSLNWSIVAYSTAAWADKVYPGLSPDEQVDRLWDDIFDICRVRRPDPIAAWTDHAGTLEDRAEFLTGKQYTALHITGPGTDLTVGLPDNHVWLGGGAEGGNGINFVPNVPTEEVFTAPNRTKVDGTVRASMPLSYSGNMIEDFSLTFKDGRAVDYSAAKGGELLKSLLDMDEGSACLGEMALVPHSSPISLKERLFYNTLYDENAASHIALGRAYTLCIDGGDDMSEEQFMKAGGNISLAHVDFMIGTAETSVDGLTADGTAEPLMRNGEFVIGPR
ncbi:MAG: aminopeptidase [Chloroflexota bacterium]